MSDRIFQNQGGESFQVTHDGQQTVRVHNTHTKVSCSCHPQIDQASGDHEISRLSLQTTTGRTALWIYHHKGKRILAWPGGSVELEALDFGETSAGAGGTLKPLKLTMPGKVLSLKVAVGDVVNQGHGLIVVEAMKMENLLLAPAPAKIAKIHVQEGDRLDSGAVLISFAPVHS